MVINEYIHQLGLPLLEKKNNDWNFRCIICGDSKKNNNKKRGWIIQDRNLYYCHNCGASMKFTTFLKLYYHHIYLDYLKTIFRPPDTKKSNLIQSSKKSKKEVIFPLSDIIPLYQLDENHECKKYVKKRKIPLKYHNLLYYCDNFQKKINELFPDKFENYPESDERLIIPFFDKNKNITYIQGRTIDKNYLRYITIKLLPNRPKIYGIERINISLPINIVEGAIDSFFLDNTIAMGSSSINFNDLLSITNKSGFIFIYDFEKRNKQIIKKIENVINQGFKICLIPHEYIKYGKDLNQFIKNGLTKEKIQHIVNNNIYSGLKAHIKLKLWKKC